MAAVSVPPFFRVALLSLLTAFGGSAAGRRKPMNTPLDAVPPAPRHVVLAVHSYSGSSQSLVAATLDLLATSKVFEEKRSTIFWYDDAKSPSGYHVLGSFTLLSSASIAQMLQTLKQVETRLGNSPQLLKTEILWVENAHVDTRDLKLPNPAILNEPWGADALVGSGEDPLADACDQGREDKSFCQAVGKAYRKPNLVVYETPVDGTINGELKDGNLECWAYAHAHDEEIVGNSVDALLAADVARRELESRGVSAVRKVAERAADAVSKRRADEVFPLEVPASGKLEEKVAAWVRAVSARAMQDRILVRRAVVFAMTPTAIRGAIIGARLPDQVAPAPIVPVTSVEVIRGGGAPLEPPSFSVSLRVQPPNLPR